MLNARQVQRLLASLRAASGATEADDSAARARVLERLGRMVQVIRDPRRARRVLEEMSDAEAELLVAVAGEGVLAKPPDISQLDRVRALQALAAAHVVLGDLETARRGFQDALRRARRLGDRAAQVVSCRWLGEVRIRSGEHAAAARALREALALSEAKVVADGSFEVSAAERAEIHLLLGVSAYVRGRFDEAREAYEGALTEVGAFGGAGLRARAHNNLGVLADLVGESVLAESHWRRALALAEMAGDSVTAGQVHYNLGFLCTHADQWEAAETHFERSEDYARRVGNEEGRALAYLGRARLYAASLDPARASAYCRLALPLLQQGEDSAGLADVYVVLAQVARLEGRLRKAGREVRRALEIAREAKLPVEEVEAMREQALLARARGNRAEALRLFQEALECAETARAYRLVVVMSEDLAQLSG